MPLAFVHQYHKEYRDRCNLMQASLGKPSCSGTDVALRNLPEGCQELATISFHRRQQHQAVVQPRMAHFIDRLSAARLMPITRTAASLHHVGVLIAKQHIKHQSDTDAARDQLHHTWPAVQSRPSCHEPMLQPQAALL